MASLISDLPACALLNTLYSTSVLRHHVSDAMQIVRQGNQQSTNEERKARYLAACSETPLDRVGDLFYATLVEIVGLRAGKITGMLLTLPKEDILKMMHNWCLFVSNTQFANDSIERDHRALLTSARFLRACWKVLPAIRPYIPNYRQHVGEIFHPYVSQLVLGKDAADMVTGMLIVRPIRDIKHMMTDF